jgi:hypothetical protein
VLSEHSKSLQHKVLDRAIKVLRMIGCSNKSYELVREGIPPRPIPSHASSWAVKDISTWGIVAARDVVGSFHCIYPGLVRKGGVGQKDLPLVQPILLGYRTLDLQPRPSHPRTPFPPKQDARRSEREGSDTRTSKSSGKPSLPKQSARPPDPKPKGPSFGANFGNMIGLGPHTPTSAQHPDLRKPSRGQ